MPQTRRLILQKARSHDTETLHSCATLPRLVGTRFQVLFHSAPAVLFTIPSRYSPLSVTREYLGLTGGPARFTQDSSSPMLLGKISKQVGNVSATGVLPSTPGHPKPFAYTTDLSLTSRPAEQLLKTPNNPAHATPAEYHTQTV
jgi:hypothetical protein